MGRSFGASVADTAVVGMGNPYCTDDGVGVAVTRRLPSEVVEGCAVWETAQSGVYLAEKLLGFSRVLIIDGTPLLPAGELRVQPLEEWEAVGGEHRGAHGMSLSRALEMLGSLTSQSGTRPRRAALVHDQVRVPEVWALAVGIPPDPPFGEGLTPRVAAAVQAAVEEVRGWLNS